jgi:hypothetical protein
MDERYFSEKQGERETRCQHRLVTAKALGLDIPRR